MKRKICIGKSASLWLAVHLVALSGINLPAQTTTEPKTVESTKGKVELSVGTEGVRVQAQSGDDSDSDQPKAKVEISTTDATTGGTTTLNDFNDRPKIRRHRIHRAPAEAPRVVIGNDLVVGAEEHVPGVVVINGSAKIDGEVDDVVVSVNSRVDINGKVHGDLVSVISTVNLGPQAEVDREVTVVGEPLTKSAGAKIHGRVNEVDLSGIIPTRDWIDHNLIHGIFVRPLPPAVKWTWKITLVAFVLNLMIALLLARPVQKCAETLVAKPIRSFIAGLLCLILFFPFALVLLPTIIGTPLLLCSLIGALLIGRVVVYRATGGQVGKQLGIAALELPLVAFLVGTLIFYAGYMVPIFGWVLWLIVMPLGAGAVVLSALGVFRREGQRPTPVPAMPANAPNATPAAAAFAMGVSAAPMPAPAMPAASSFAATSTEPGAASAVPPPLSPPPLASGPSMAAAEFISLPRVGFWPRLGATFLDVVLVTVCCVFSFDHGPFFWWFALIAYHVGMWTWKGTTLGGIIFGLKVVRLDGRALDWSIALVRALAGCLSLMVFGLGFFWASWSAERQSWHDIIAGTTIVKLPKTVPLI